MANKARKRGKSSGAGWLRRMRIPPWLFYVLVCLFGAGALALMVWGLLHPQSQP